MTLKLAINGFGRIGRCVLRAAYETGRDDLEIVAINDLTDPKAIAHLLRYDSVHGRFGEDVQLKGDVLEVGGKPIRLSSEKAPEDLNWGDIDVVLECTGIFRSHETASRHLTKGAGKVLISAPAGGSTPVKTIVYGVNEDELGLDDRIVSNASCTTNCLAPIAKVLDERFGIVSGQMTTIHSYTGDQPTHDRGHSDLYRARAAAMSMIPTSTGAAKALGEVLPNLKGKLDGSAIRVPTPNVSAVDLTFVAARDVTKDEVNAAIQAATGGAMTKVLGYAEDPLVSIDFNHAPQSSVFAPDQTRVVNGRLVRVLSWYDNEWGFSCRMLDTASAMGAVEAVGAKAA
ncbi:type I glyceraldehyde-3-phosphate dehydrogenase [Falsiphaeobacter marinintestinus]|uniref:type I glyceraldehyde-3-phosphate dehydrogenase n=1 Tax=Falsiphaeobacter marinintestinus TaxID=1492905 RepID=UPI0011B7C32F|nr:type I glyceraldehyde-3-phosphate dehydrogenase [Phaeobacter marinintestinus]